ncbi:TonB-dependent receptor, partial [Mycobacterium tuberculosis]|nr:TonB-dependent receptor [Mycobacterium tuberculosis]
MAGQPSRLRAEAAATWLHKDLATTFALHFVNSERDVAGKAISSWTTADLQLRYRPSGNVPVVRNVDFTLSVRNLFDSAPPFY